MKSIQYTPIGVIHTPFNKLQGMPIQSSGAKDIRGVIDLYPEYQGGLKDVEGFSHLLLIYHFHLSKKFSLQVEPFLDDQPRGVFATRAPNRPNPIGVTVVSLEKIEGTKIHVTNVDIMDGTPLIDIKPYVPQFDAAERVRIGWLEGRVGQSNSARSDKRFK